MRRWIWVRQDTALAIHSEQLRVHGGGNGIRDAGLLQSAMARPVNLAAHGEPDIAALAASYGFGIARNHPFIDGNKRTAYVVMELFLMLNGYELSASDSNAVITYWNVADGTLSELQLSEWIRSNIVEI
jgi:death on curing protein